MKHSLVSPRALVLVTLVPLLAACSRTTAAVGAGAAAAAAAIAYSDRGATTSVDISVTRMADATELGIRLDERETQKDGIELKGTDGEWKVVVDIERDPDEVLTSTEVTVSRNQIDYSKSRAERILRTILSRAS